jgi:Flp pilus assembly protein TadB
MLLRTVEQIRRWLRITAGFTLLLAGVLLIATPTPGALVIFLGLGLLAAEFVWAGRLMNRVKQEGMKWKEAVLGISRK